TSPFCGLPRSRRLHCQARSELHSMWNAGDEPARMIEIITPAGFEKYFIALAKATAAAGGRPDPSITAPIAERFGLSFDFTKCLTWSLDTGSDHSGDVVATDAGAGAGRENALRGN
ncbi:MAG TPA: hypothetical protein VI094_18800, partial [Propionibacteriaceae bacterium]